MNKPLEYWIALAAAAFYVFQRSSDKPIFNRLSMTAISSALGYSLTGDLVNITQRPEILVLVATTTLIYLLLDFSSAIISDRRLLIDMIRKVLKK